MPRFRGEWRHWTDNYATVIAMERAVAAFARVGADDYERYAKRRTSKMEDDEAREAVLGYGADFGMLRQWIGDGIAALNADRHLPDALVVPELDWRAHDEVWRTHISGTSRQSLNECARLVGEHARSMGEALEAYRAAEVDSGHSSYSDYSDSDTESSGSERSGGKERLSGGKERLSKHDKERHDKERNQERLTP